MARTARSTRTQTRASLILANAMFTAKKVEPEFYTDSKGRTVRKFTAENPCGRAEVRELLVNVRAFDEFDALEVIGANVLQYMLKVGYVVKHGHFYYVTKSCAAKYDLPAYMGVRTFVEG